MFFTRISIWYAYIERDMYWYIYLQCIVASHVYIHIYLCITTTHTQYCIVYTKTHNNTSYKYVKSVHILIQYVNNICIKFVGIHSNIMGITYHFRFIFAKNDWILTKGKIVILHLVLGFKNQMQMIYIWFLKPRTKCRITVLPFVKIQSCLAKKI